MHRPAAWLDAAAAILGGRPRRVMVLGPVDAGKSSFCGFLAAAASSAGLDVEGLCTDLGQKWIGPPACVTRGHTDGEGGLALQDLAFVGTTDPVRGSQALIEGAARLAWQSRAEMVVMNTSGLLAGPGWALKAKKIAALDPDCLVAVGDDLTFDRLLADYRGRLVVRVPSSPFARRKTEGERRAARREAFRAYFADATVQPWPAEASGLEADGSMLPRHLSALAADGRDLGLGIAVEEGCLTPVGMAAVRAVRWGAIMVDEAFRDRPLAMPERRPPNARNPARREAEQGS
ncbi:MAG TPA: Clp1/GlmU family protein [Microvirga sp.]|nr:Clp1/GlmU family protein [Microvirga sp.]